MKPAYLSDSSPLPSILPLSSPPTADLARDTCTTCLVRDVVEIGRKASVSVDDAKDLAASGEEAMDLREEDLVGVTRDDTEVSNKSNFLADKAADLSWDVGVLLVREDAEGGVAAGVEANRLVGASV